MPHQSMLTLFELQRNCKTLYYSSTKVFYRAGIITTVSFSYADTNLNTFTDIQAHLGKNADEQSVALNPNVADFTNDKVGGNFYDVMNVL
jgi:hypothetical protein